MSTLSEVALIVRFVLELLKLINQNVDKAERAEKIGQLVDGIKKANETKDTSSLSESLRNIASN